MRAVFLNSLTGFVSGSTWFKSIFFAFALLAVQIAEAQQYPVQVQPTIKVAPVFLSDYTDPSNLNVRVFLSDLQKQDYQVRLKFKLSSSAVTITSTNGIVLTLNGGQASFLNSIELQELFSVNNTTSSKGPITKLPEGVYTLSFEAYDERLYVPGATNNIVVSNALTDFVITTVSLFDPPMLSMPASGQSFDLQMINQNIFFNWTPRHIVYSAAQQIKYKFKLIKVTPVDRNPYDAMNVTLPAVVEARDLDFPTYIYTPADLQLEEGNVYAWQVTAYEVINGVDNSERFKNQGKSEVFTFAIKEDCKVVSGFKKNILNRTVTLSWDKEYSHKEYELTYRPSGTTASWVPVLTGVTPSATLDSTTVETGVTYEYRVRAMCKNWTDYAYGGTFKLEPATCPAPEPVIVDNSGPTDMKLSWSAVEAATSYNVFYKKTGETAYSQLDPVTGKQEANLAKLTSGSYELRVDAVCDAVTGKGKEYTVSYNDNGLLGPCPIPAPFKLIAQRVKGDTATLAWSNNAIVHDGYSITYWDKDSVSRKYTIDSNVPSVTGKKIFDDELYVYQITYKCGSKNVTTPQGMFRIDASDGGVVTNPKTADCFPPSILQGEARSTTSALFEWNKVSGADEYQLYYTKVGSKKFEPFNTTSKSATISPLAESSQYKFVVRCRCGSQYSIYSDTALVDLSKGKTNTNCDSSAYFRSDKQLTTEIRLYWKYNEKHTGYKLTYREVDQSPSEEYTQVFSDIVAFKKDHLVPTGDTAKYTFNNLKPGTAYIFKLQALCGTDEAMRNAPFTISTQPDAKSAGGCGGATLCDKTNTKPLTTLKEGGTFKCADYEIKVTKLEASSNAAAGLYTGNGTMPMPIVGVSDFATVSVSFKNVKINEAPASCVYEGTVNIDSVNASLLPTEVRNQVKDISTQIHNTIDQANAAIAEVQGALTEAQKANQQAIDYFQGGGNTGKVKDGGLGESVVTGSIPVDTKKATVSGKQVTIAGQSATVSSFPALITDKDGNIFQVTSNGDVANVGKYDNTLVPVPALDMAGGKVIYTENTSARYDFDAYIDAFKVSPQLTKAYELIGTDYYVPAKLLLPGELDVVNATVSGYDASKIKFANGKGAVFNSVPNGTNGLTVTIPGGLADDAQEVYAWFIDGTTKKVIGKLLAPSYSPQQKQVVIIPVGTATVDGPKYAAALNGAYQKIGITYTVTVDESFRKNKDWDSDFNGLVQATGSKALSNDYQGEEAAMIQAYVDSKGGDAALDGATAYFLAIYEASNLEDGLLGKMPAEQQFGFLYVGAQTSSNENSFYRTIAHEIGHGAYHLEHSFVSIYLGEKSSKTTQNLMDYTVIGNPVQLWKLQWDIIHDPGHVWGILKKDKDSQLKAGFWYNPAGMPNNLPASMGNVPTDKIVSGIYPNGAVYGFTTSEGEYEAKILNGLFYGYYLTDKNGALTDRMYTDIGTFSASGQVMKVMSLVYNGDCTDDYILTSYKVDSKLITKAADYKKGVPIATSIPTTGTLVADGDNVKIGGCGSADIKSGVGKTLYDSYKAGITDPTVLAEFEKMCGKVNVLGLNLYNQYNTQVKANQNIDNYSFFGFWHLLYQKEPARLSLENIQNLSKQLDAFILAVNKLKSGTFKDYKELVKLVNDYFVAGGDAYKAFYKGAFSEITYERRVELLKLFANVPNSDITGRGNIGSLVESEDVIIALITSNPAGSSKNLLDMLYSTKLLYKFIEAFDDYGYGEFANLSEYLSFLASQSSKAYSPDPTFTLQYAVNNKKAILYNSDYFVSNTETINTDGTFNFVVNKWPLNLGAETYNVTSKPYEFIYVHFKTDFTLGSGAKAKTFTGGANYKLPTILVYLMFNSNTRDKIVSSAQYTFDAASMAVGVGELTMAIKAARWGGAGLAFLEIGIGAGDIIMSGYENEIKAAYPNFYDTWNVISTCYNFGTMGLDGFEMLVGDCKLNCSLIKKENKLSAKAMAKIEDINTWCTGHGGCFAKGTLIKTPKGETSVEFISKGDLVLAKGESDTSKVVFEKVTETFKKVTNSIVKVFTSKETIVTTQEHPFYTSKGWLKAGMLTKGLKVLTLSGLLVTIDSIYTEAKSLEVYNLTVENSHNYFVGSEGILVHNIDCAQMDNWLQISTDKLGDNQTMLGDFIKEFKNSSLQDKFILDKNTNEGLYEAYKLFYSSDGNLSAIRLDIDNLENGKAILQKIDDYGLDYNTVKNKIQGLKDGSKSITILQLSKANTKAEFEQILNSTGIAFDYKASRVPYPAPEGSTIDEIYQSQLENLETQRKTKTANEKGKLSEDAAELAADAKSLQMGWGNQVCVNCPTGAGTFDRIYVKDGFYTVVECKGGTSELGGRIVGTNPKKYAQQGTKEYFIEIIAKMKASSNQDLRNMAAELQDAMDDGLIRYVEVRQGFDSSENLKSIEVNNFDVF